MTLNNSVFLSGVELPDGSLMMGAQNGDFDIAATPHGIIKARSPEGEWRDAGQVRWTSACVAANPAGDGVTLISAYGRWLELRKDGHAKGSIIEDVDEDDPPTVFRFAKTIAGQLYAGGTDRFLFRQASTGWERVSSEAMVNSPEAGSAEGLAGFGPDELYAVGWDGEIHTNHGGEWHRVQSPVELILNDADVLGDRVYIGGQTGVILEGRGSEWGVIENEEMPDDIWSVCGFQDAVYFASTSGILRLRDGELSLVRALGPDLRSTMTLFTGPSGLWSVGSSDIALFDGESWRTIAQS